jgi:predicted AAA+ superfamily ATPase
LAALAFDPDQPWTLDEFCHQDPSKLAKWYEWAVASHLWKKSAYQGAEDPESQFFWSNENHEIDFISAQQWIEVKSGKVSPIEFRWFVKSFPQRSLRVVTKSPLEIHPSFLKTETLEAFLRS